MSRNHGIFLTSRFSRLISLPTSTIFVSGTSGFTAILKYRSVNPIVVCVWTVGFFCWLMVDFTLVVSLAFPLFAPVGFACVWSSAMCWFFNCSWNFSQSFGCNWINFSTRALYLLSWLIVWSYKCRLCYKPLIGRSFWLICLSGFPCLHCVVRRTGKLGKSWFGFLLVLARSEDSQLYQCC